MRYIAADIETDGLLDSLTRVHSLSLRNIDTNEVVSCADQPGYTPIAEGLRLLSEAEKVYFHNGIRFDYPALRKVYPEWDMDRSRLMDTFIIASMRWAHIRESDYERARRGKFPSHLAGSHMLEAWGYRLGLQKGEYTKWCQEQGIADPWAEWRPEMQSYCDLDTEVTRELVFHIRKHGVSPESVEIEHGLAWYLAQQERNGVPFDREAAIQLQAKLAARREEVEQELKRIFGSWEKVWTEEFTPKRNNKKLGWVAGVTITREKRKVIEFNPRSRQQIAERLQTLYGWEPTAYTNSGQPQVDETTLKGLDQNLPGVKELQEYLLLGKRIGQIAEGDEAWLVHMTKDGPEGGKLTGLTHIHGRVKQNHAITHRAAHAKPNLGQVPKVGKPFGAECRALFIVPPSYFTAQGAPVYNDEDPDAWVMVGADASGLEARCLGHYLAKYDGGAYAKLLLEGDVHSVNREALGMPEGKPFRDAAKNWYYAWMFGAGDEKLGKMLAVPMGLKLSKAELKKLGAKKKNQFLKNTPAFKQLLEAVKQATKKRGYVTMPDGRRTYIRSDHSALNSLIQSSGAVICKRWIVNFTRRLEEEFGPQGWTGSWVALLWIHDEVQLAVRRKYAARVAEILVEEIRKVTDAFTWRIPLDGEAKIGYNWRDTH